MNKIRKQKVFMNTWDFEFIRELTWMSKEILTQFYI